LTDIGASEGASERDEWLRAAWRVTLAGNIDPRRLVFVDEMGANTALSPRYAYSSEGSRAYAKVPRNRGANTTLLASMNLKGMGPCMAVRGPTTATVFEAYIEKVLAPSLRCRQIVVVDNLGAHKSERAGELINQRGCQLLYLPPYSPDFNPIEEAFSKIKGALRKAGARTREALIEALGVAISAVTTRDARGFFEHSGYHLPVHLLWNTL
jgi:transposase